MKRVRVVLAICIASSLACLIAAAAETSARRALTPCVTITGADSQVLVPQYHRITSDDAWMRIWREHMGKSWQERRERIGQRRTDASDLREPVVRPLIDFDNYMVIGIFLGEGVNATGMKLSSISEEDDRILIRYDKQTYQTMGRAGSSRGADKVTVYGFFILPQSTKRVVLEENVQNYLGQPPVWNQRFAFPSLVAPGQADAARATPPPIPPAR